MSLSVASAVSSVGRHGSVVVLVGVGRVLVSQAVTRLVVLSPLDISQYCRLVEAATTVDGPQCYRVSPSLEEPNRRFPTRGSGDRLACFGDGLGKGLQTAVVDR
jgi:hypothetical protein